MSLTDWLISNYPIVSYHTVDVTKDLNGVHCCTQKAERFVFDVLVTLLLIEVLRSLFSKFCFGDWADFLSLRWMYRFSDGVVTLAWPDRAFKAPDPVSKIPVYMNCPLLESLTKIWSWERHTMHRITFWLLTLSVTFWIMKLSDYLQVLYKRFSMWSQATYLAYWLFFFPRFQFLFCPQQTLLSWNKVKSSYSQLGSKILKCIQMPCQTGASVLKMQVWKQAKKK